VGSALDAVGAADLPLLQTEPLGLQESIIELATNRFREATDPQISPAETCLLLIGRGSRDAEATADMRQLGALLHQRLCIGQTQVGFLAMAEPSAQDVIQATLKSSYRQVVVQPHLLFHGELLDRLQAYVEAAAASAPAKSWRLSRVLGEETGSLAHILQQAIHSLGNSKSGVARARATDITSR